ncbi:heme exporter protein CcmB [Marinicella sp. S1101]|uniref:heme exporter protein CcmB n=1 Tax=Marinicella marina TaxID=2996016 RepID=UPI0022609749|nr:heme exporter protein CcmB [Marinicella marina]MCX7554516.1 heme exporter protein CcmB [Marinicella marina]MDJ1140667.1 heme exporter protein CcmB [Marinicella marina]
MMPFWALFKRDVLVAWRRKANVYQPLVFQLLIVTMFPLGLGAGAATLTKIAPAVVWILALLSTLITLENIFKDDYEDGSLAVYALSGMNLPLAVISKAAAHWCTTGIPVILFAPVIGMLLHLPTHAYAVLLLSLTIATPIFSLLGTVGSALIMNIKSGGMLLSVLIMPLLAPVLIFGAGAVLETALSNSASTHLMLLSGSLVLCLTLAPLAAAAAIKINLE